MAKKKPSVPTLKRKLDDVFSIYIRLRDSDQNGYCKCISCGAIYFWKGGSMHNGHYVNRSHMSLRYDEKNCNAQCINCNSFDEGNNIGYTRGIIKKYGAEILDILEWKKSQQKKYHPFEYEIMIKEYQQKAKELAKEKGLEI